MNFSLTIFEPFLVDRDDELKETKMNE